MAALVTLAEVKRGLKVDSSDNDTLLEFLIMAASGAIINYLKDQADTLISAPDSPQDSDNLPEIKQATILLTGIFFDNPDQQFEPGYLPAPVTALLYTLRDPALA